MELAIQALAQSRAGRPKRKRQLPPIPFGEWLPDQAELGNSGATEAQNVIPFGPGSFKPLPDITTVSASALTNRCQGAIAVQGDDGFTYTYAADDNGLWSLIDTTWTDISKSGGYNVNADELTRFHKFGSTLLWTNIDDPVQGVTIGGTAFADQFTSTLKPQARHIATVGRFLVLGNTSESDVRYPHRLRWGAIDSGVDMDESAANQSGSRDLNSNDGWIQYINGGDYGTVFCEHAIYRMVYVGSPQVFDLDRISENRGALAAHGVTRIGNQLFFLAHDGFFRWDGQQAIPLSDGKVTEYFFDNVATDYLFRVVAGSSDADNIVVWAWTDSASEGNPTRLLLCHWPTATWARGHITTEFLFEDMSKGRSLDDLDNVTTDLDALTHSLDSRFWTGGRLRLGAFDSSHRLNTFTGSNLAAVIDTKVQQLFPGHRAKVTGAIPLVDGGTPTVQVAGAARMNDSFSFESAGTLTTDGKVPVRNKSRYHKFRLNVPAASTWSHAQGIQPIASQVGGR